ncbi:hypothetical protein GIB67_002194 [Kingdonia uniflora]|uniref:PWWP domain-containing protein n=1 Tax=Kingdonia uniflora TaxID=39325 RepID=A0A7J7KWP9_9MAGN|nr:hypothetical protein GIB67_002194 [Kingdonia uniflora]
MSSNLPEELDLNFDISTAMGTNTSVETNIDVAGTLNQGVNNEVRVSNRGGSLGRHGFGGGFDGIGGGVLRYDGFEQTLVSGEGGGVSRDKNGGFNLNSKVWGADVFGEGKYCGIGVTGVESLEIGAPFFGKYPDGCEKSKFSQGEKQEIITQVVDTLFNPVNGDGRVGFQNVLENLTGDCARMDADPAESVGASPENKYDDAETSFSQLFGDISMGVQEDRILGSNNYEAGDVHGMYENQNARDGEIMIDISLLEESQGKEDITSSQNEKDVIYAQVTETLFNPMNADERIDLPLFQRNPNGDLVKMESNPFVDTTSGLAESVGISLHDCIDSDIKGNEITEVEAVTDVADFSRKLSENQIMKRNDSGAGVDLGMYRDQTSCDDVVMEGLINECPGKEANAKDVDIGIEISLPDKHGNLKVETLEQITEFEKVRSAKKNKMEGEFNVTDMVWGKVRSHPWWPGQIFEPSDSSDYAMKQPKKDNSYLVAYFGDGTFAWNEASSLKPFQTHFPRLGKQSTLESFQVAVDCALDEVSRRVEFGLSCPCVPEVPDDDMFKTQIIENAGIRIEARRRDVAEKTAIVTSFEPEKLVEYTKRMALDICSGGDRLEHVTAQAQLLAFCRSKGYARLPEFHMYRGFSGIMVVDGAPISRYEEEAPSRKRKPKRHDSSSDEYDHEEGGLSSKKKKKSSMYGTKSKPYDVDDVKSSDNEDGARMSTSLTSSKKRKRGRTRLSASRHTKTESLTPRDSNFKVRDRIRRSGSKPSGSRTVVKSINESHEGAVNEGQISEQFHEASVADSPHTPEGSQSEDLTIPKNYLSPDEMLSQLCLVAQDPMKGHSFLTVTVNFFTDLRKLINHGDPNSVKHKKSKKKTVVKNDDSLKEENSIDTYWTDRIVQNNPEEKSSCDSQLETTELNNQKASDTNGKLESEKIEEDSLKKPAGDSSPSELILNFTDVESIPSEAELNEIFSHFDSLKDSETEILKKKRRARVVFGRRTDAEEAFSKAGKFSIFGPALASYQLRYSSATPCIRAMARGLKNSSSSDQNKS